MYEILRPYISLNHNEVSYFLLCEYVTFAVSLRSLLY